MSHTQFVQSFLDTIAARDWDALRAITTPDMKQQVLPYSLSQPEVDRETWITKLADTLAFVPDWKITLEGNVVGDDNGISFHVCSPSRIPTSYEIYIYSGFIPRHEHHRCTMEERVHCHVTHIP